MAVSEIVRPKITVPIIEKIRVTRTHRRPITLTEGFEAMRRYEEARNAQIPPVRTREFVLAELAKRQS